MANSPMGYTVNFFCIEEINNFLNPTIKSNLPNPFDLLDMNLAVNKVITTIKDNVINEYPILYSKLNLELK
jgi:hypothetical protein